MTTATATMTADLAATEPLPVRDRGNGIEGYGCPAFRRAIDVGLLTGLMVKHNPTPRELEICVSDWRKKDARELDNKVFQLLARRTAPDPECADEVSLFAFSTEQNVADLIASRLRGFLPAKMIDDVATAGAAAAFGAELSVQRFPAEAAERQLWAIRTKLLEGGRDDDQNP